MPESITTIGHGAFANGSLESINIPNSVTEIGESAFYECELTSVEIPSGVKKIPYGAFGLNYNLSEIILNEGLETIEGSAFSYCRNIDSVNIPSTVTSLSSTAFNCRMSNGINIA